jgi:hypothetical protein
MPNFDVVVFRANQAFETGGDRRLLLERPLTDRIDLGDGLSIQCLPRRVSDAVSRACSAGAVASIVPQRYAFVRAYAGDAGIDGDFDVDEGLRIATALSRLVQPTSVALEESAQISVERSLDEDREPTRIRPGPICGPAAQAWIADPRGRDWLTADDGHELAALLGSYFSRPVPALLRRGLFFHEFAACTLDGAVRWTLVVTGLEALVNTDGVGVTKQFVERTVAIAAECGVGFTRRDAQTAYKSRSRVAHGKVTGFAGDTLVLYVATERVLREALRRGFRDPAWGDAFETEASVRNRWPIELNRICPACGQERPVEPGG